MKNKQKQAFRFERLKLRHTKPLNLKEFEITSLNLVRSNLKNPVIRSLGNAHMNSPTLGGGTFPHWGYLEYLGLLDPEANLTPYYQQKRLRFTYEELAALLNLRRDTASSLMGWFRDPADANTPLKYGRFTAPVIYDLCTALGVPLSGLLTFDRRMNDQQTKNLSLHMGLQMLEFSREHLEDFDGWVFNNLTCQFSCINKSLIKRYAYTHRRTFRNKPLMSSWHHSLNEEQLAAMPTNLRQMCRNLRQMLKDDRVDMVRKTIPVHIQPLEASWAYWTLERMRYLDKKARLPRGRGRGYFSQHIEATEYNQLDFIPKKFPDFDLPTFREVPLVRSDTYPPTDLVKVQTQDETRAVAYSKAQEESEIGINTEIKVGTSTDMEAHAEYMKRLEKGEWPNTMPVQDRWKRAIVGRFVFTRKATRRKWLPLHALIMESCETLMLEAVESIQPGVFHGSWHWLEEIQRLIEKLRLHFPTNRNECKVQFDLLTLFRLSVLVPNTQVIDTDTLSRVWLRLSRNRQVRDFLEQPEWYGKPHCDDQRVVLHPTSVELIRDVMYSFLGYEMGTVEKSLRKMVELTMLHPRRKNFTRTDVSWVDILWHLKYGTDIRPRVRTKVSRTQHKMLKLGLIETDSTVPEYEECLCQPLQFQPLVDLGVSWMMRLWVMSPGTTAQSSRHVIGGVSHTIGLLPFRGEVIGDVFEALPTWKGFQSGRWTRWARWFNEPVPAGSTLTQMAHDNDRAGLENSLCQTEDNIENRLIPMLRFAHVPMPTFIRWMMKLREEGQEVEACHYYLHPKVIEVGNTRKRVIPMKRWRAPCYPLEERKQDQLYTLWKYYLKAAKEFDVKVPTDLKLKRLDSWFSWIEKQAIEKGDLKESKLIQESADNEAALLRHEIEVVNDGKAIDAVAARRLAELEGGDG